MLMHNRRASMSSVLTRTRFPFRRTVPSSTLATPNALAIWHRSRFWSARYCMTDVRLITVSRAILARLLRISS